MLRSIEIIQLVYQYFYDLEINQLVYQCFYKIEIIKLVQLVCGTQIYRLKFSI